MTRAIQPNLSLPESGSRFTSELLLSHFGIGLEDVSASFLGATDANLRLLDGSIDVSMQWTAAPYPLLQQLFRGGRVALLSIDPQVVGGLRANQPFLVPGIIPASTYANQGAAVSTVAVKALLVGATSRGRNDSGANRASADRTNSIHPRTPELKRAAKRCQLE